MTARSTIKDERSNRQHPVSWVPTLYFAEGIPFYVVNYLALVFYRTWAWNAVTTLVISMLALPWTLKPMWSPMLEMYKTKKFFVVGTELVGGLSLVLIALSLNMPDFFRYSVAIFVVIGLLFRDPRYCRRRHLHRFAHFKGAGRLYRLARRILQSGARLFHGRLAVAGRLFHG
jgi:hypothetical protein